MPTYEYACEKCGHEFECVQSMKDNALTTCPKDVCPKKTWGKGKVKRGIGSGAEIIFKGSGFYITDYRSEGYKTAAKSDAEAAKPKTETKSETKTEAAPAAAAAPAPAAKGAGKKKA
jgi:putative FmdB family regulatory protein